MGKLWGKLSIRENMERDKVKLIHPESKRILSAAMLDERNVKNVIDLYSKFSLRNYHTGTFYHCQRVGLGAVDLGIFNELSEEELMLLGLSGLLHDIGKIKTPLEILDNTGDLTEEQWKVVKRHTIDGFRILHGFDYNIRLVALLHHIYKTQNPYPTAEEVQGEVMYFPPQRVSDVKSNLLDLVQIVSVVDMFDVLVHGRPYSPPKKPEEVEEILRRAYSGEKRYIDQVLEKL